MRSRCSSQRGPATVYAPECFSARFDDASLHSANLSSSGTSYCLTLDDPPLFTSTCGGAGFAGADLSRANLSGADLSFADLAGADLVRTDFTGALFASCPPSILELAVCSSTNLDGASTTGTNFTHPVWASTTCPDGTNSDTDGKTCVHNLL